MVGVLAKFGVASSGPARTEDWMESHSLSRFGSYKMVQGDGPDRSVTYKMDPSTYKELAPYGIVARQFTDGSESFDVVLIASQAKASFHDPRVCFTAQGWQLDNESSITIPTKHRGMVPATITQIRSDQGVRWAAFFYRGPEGFAPSTNDLKLQMFKYSLLNSKSTDGVFYRFIAGSADISREALVKFIGSYLDASASEGGGTF